MATDESPTGSRPVDQAALDRVLARAAELQVASSDRTSTGVELTEAEIVEIGKEAGLSQEHIRVALAEERTRGTSPEKDRGLGSAIFGGARVRCTRILGGTTGPMLSAIDAWMQSSECLQVKRRFDDRVVWEPRKDLVGNLRRALNVGGRGYHLARAHEVIGTVTAVDDDRVMVTLEVDLSSHRSRVALSVTVVSGMSVAASASLVVMSVIVPVAVIPALIVPLGSVFIAREVQQGAVQRTRLAMEQLLDRLEHGETVPRPPSILGTLAAVALPRR